MPGDDQETFRQFVDSHLGDRIYLGLLGPPRPGVRVFFAALQNYLESKRVEFHMVVWNGVLWGAMAVPQSKGSLADALMQRCGLSGKFDRPVADAEPGQRPVPEFPSDRSLTMLDSHPDVVRFGRVDTPLVLKAEQVLVAKIEAGERPNPNNFIPMLWGFRMDFRRDLMEPQDGASRPRLSGFRAGTARNPVPPTTG